MFQKDPSSAPFNRLPFTALLAAAGVPSSQAHLPGTHIGRPEVLRLSRNAWVPNNSELPVLIYHSALDVLGPDPAASAEELIRRNGWPPQWRNGIYEFHHYHSTAHEVLGIIAGNATVILGGPGGCALTVKAGDLVVLPAGTGHCCTQSSSNLLVVGGYPPGQSWDICRSAPSQAERDRMRTLPFPASDPVTGPSGALVRLWRDPANETAA